MIEPASILPTGPIRTTRRLTPIPPRAHRSGLTRRATLQPVTIPFSQRIREETRAAHTRAESAKFIRGFLCGMVDATNYRQLLVNYHHVYSVMERALTASAACAPVAAVTFPALFRTPALVQDLDYFAGPDWAAHLAPSPATRLYARRIEEIARTAPELLVAHAYTRYLGDLSGGQILKRTLRTALVLPAGVGTAFYDFPQVTGLAAAKQEFRSRLDSLAVSASAHDAMIAEANLVFRHNLALFEELEGNTWSALLILFTSRLGLTPSWI